MQPRIVIRASTPNEEFADAYDVLRGLLIDRGPDDSGLGGTGTELALLQCCGTSGAQLWGTLADEAEHHGVTPLVEPVIARLARKRPDLVPDDVRRAFVALTRRHRRAAATREKSIDQLLAAFAAARIPIVLLKGAALAHLVYPNPELRPMVDIDVLIAPADTERAIRITRGLGYIFAGGYGSPFAGLLHHLPVATTNQSGFRIALDIHVDTMSPNQAESLTFATLAEKPQPFQRGSGQNGFALSHTDMLRHLARHAFEPNRRVRLIHLYDLWRYQTKFRDEIDWYTLEKRFPHVIIVLQLVSYVFPSAPAVDRRSDATTKVIPAGVGFGMVPLSEIVAMDSGLAAKLVALFNPPAWWLHGFYAVPLDKSLLVCRTIRHPATVARWLARRLVAIMSSPAWPQATIDHSQQERVTQLKS
jgi:Uncharacterised nucleotidyltransferase